MSDADALDRLWLALANVMSLVAQGTPSKGAFSYPSPWFRGVRVYRGKARVELLLGDIGDKNQVSTILEIPLETLRVAEHGEIEVTVHNQYRIMLKTRRAMPVLPGSEMACVGTSNDDEDDE